MTTLLVMMFVLVVISLALDVLILASLGNIAQLFKPKNAMPFSINVDARGAVLPETIAEAVRQAAGRSRYDA